MDRLLYGGLRRTFRQTGAEYVVDLNSASEEEIQSIPVLDPQRARTLCDARPFESWDEVNCLAGFETDLVDDLKIYGARICPLDEDELAFRRAWKAGDPFGHNATMS